MFVVMVGAPFEAQSLYGPFNDFEDAAAFADAGRQEYTWIVTLNPVPTEENQ